MISVIWPFRNQIFFSLVFKFFGHCEASLYKWPLPDIASSAMAAFAAIFKLELTFNFRFMTTPESPFSFFSFEPQFASAPKTSKPIIFRWHFSKFCKYHISNNVPLFFPFFKIFIIIYRFFISLSRSQKLTRGSWSELVQNGQDHFGAQICPKLFMV